MEAKPMDTEDMFNTLLSLNGCHTVDIYEFRRMQTITHNPACKRPFQIINHDTWF